MEIHDLERVYELDGCDVGTGSPIAVFVRGHISTLAMRLTVAYECDDQYQTWDIRREWWRDVPLSIFDPEAEPCGDREPMVFDLCRPTAPGAYPVTVVGDC